MFQSDIMSEILSRVPAKSIFECKSVSKPWRDIVRGPSFTQVHLNHLIASGKSSFIFLCRKGKNLYYSEYDEDRHEAPFDRRTRMNLNPPFNRYSIVGSCNGLICFNSYDSENYGPAYICNPITREYIMLPTSIELNWWTGFGYICSTNEYKVVRINESGIVQVYTLGSGTGWRYAGTLDIYMETVRKAAGAFVNGALYWVKKVGIVAFHLADEKFSQVPQPPPCLTGSGAPGVPYSSIDLGVLGDFLSATYHYAFNVYDIWLLKKNRDNNDFSWSKELSFLSRISRPFGYTKSGRFLCYGDNTISSYDPEASSAAMDVGFGKYVYQAIPHKNTLVSLKVLGEMDSKIMASGDRANSSEKKIKKLKKPHIGVRGL